MRDVYHFRAISIFFCHYVLLVFETINLTIEEYSVTHKWKIKWLSYANGLG